MAVSLKPRWQIPTRPARDTSGVERGGRGAGELKGDDFDFLQTFDPEADKRIFGRQAVGHQDKGATPDLVIKGRRR